jgi:threonine/homoserine/homoserine lactone efflux protein
MPSTSHLVAFTLAAFVLIVIPGPSVLFAIGRALSAGRRDALLTVVGNAAGAGVGLVAVALGLGAVVAASAAALTVIKLAGAAYLIYLGVQAFRERRSLTEALSAKAGPVPGLRALRQGFVVGVTNPKTMIFFVAVLPQFIDERAGHPAAQIVLLGSIFLAIALISDSTWALVAGAARSWFARSPRRLEMVGGTGGLMIIGLGATVAVTGAKD